LSNFSGSNGKGEKAGKRVVYTLLFLSPLFIFALLNLLVLWRTGEGLPCTFYLFTGKYCPSCGAGRMFYSILSFRFYQAFRYNPLLFISLPVLFMILARYIISYIRGKRTVMTKLEFAFFIFLIISFVLFGILRNLEPFSFLAPTEV